MNLKILGAIAGLSVASVGALAGVAVAQNSGKFAATKAETVQTTRRIWVVNADNWWVNNVVVKAEGASAEPEYVNVYWVYDGYYNGLGYADISSANTSVAFKASETETDMTASIALPDQIDALNDSADVFWLPSGKTGDHRNCYIKTDGAGLGESEMRIVLSHFATCNTSFAYGYNAYPQLMVNFWNPSNSTAKEGTVYEGNNESGKDILKTDKIAKMRELYNKDHGTNLL